VYFYQTTRPNIPEDSHIHSHNRETLKSHPSESLGNDPVSQVRFPAGLHNETTTEIGPVPYMIGTGVYFQGSNVAGA
jgi:hypothetical protein